MRKFCTAVAVALSMAGAGAAAQDLGPDRVYITLGSKHFGDFESTLNPGERIHEFNPGVLASWQDRFASLDYTVGIYKDSLGDASAHLSVAKLWKQGEDLQYGVVAAYVQPLDDIDVLGYFVPSLQVSYKNVFTNFTAGADANGVYGVLGFGLTFGL